MIDSYSNRHYQHEDEHNVIRNMQPLNPGHFSPWFEILFVSHVESEASKTVAIWVQNDTIGKIELIPLFVLSSDNTNCKNDIQ